MQQPILMGPDALVGVDICGGLEGTRSRLEIDHGVQKV